MKCILFKLKIAKVKVLRKYGKTLQVFSVGTKSVGNDFFEVRYLTTL
jgi:hypothetical protein